MGRSAFLADLRCWQAVLPEPVGFTGLTGATVRGWWLPPLPPALPVSVVTPVKVPRSVRPGLLYDRTIFPVPLEERAGLRVASPVETLLSCAQYLSPLDLWAVLEGALAAGELDLSDLSEVTASGRAYSRRLREAGDRAHGCFESIYEVLLCALHESAGVAVVPQHEVFDEQTGAFVARGDLWVVGTREFHEYDGDVHAERHQRRRDLRRARRLVDADWVRCGYTSRDVLDQPLGVLRDCDRALGRPHDPARIRPWLDLLRASCFTPAGRGLLAASLGVRTAA